MLNNHNSSTLTIDFGNDNIQTISDIADVKDAIKLTFADRYSVNTGASGVTSLRETNNTATKLILKVMKQSQDNQHFQDWLTQENIGDVYPLNATLKKQDETIHLVFGVIIKDIVSKGSGDDTYNVYRLIFAQSKQNFKENK